ncbi:MAG TPA: ABC transporter ATP-binding protein [Actinomycetota bacterium]|nr:ABC transporter ATP-binding protein [Actinomycetota bacterium]
MDAVIETSGLSKRFRRRVAVHPIDLSVPPGSIFGYLGPNGAGKTTTIRMLLGLARPTAGDARLLGRPVPRGLGAVRLKIGSVLENPAFYPRFSARHNLRLLTSLAADPDARARISPLLDRVGLLDRAGDRVRSYSHGMRQRLALAAALIHDPDLIVLDEPATALDPAGIRDVRALLAALRDEGKTIFISSHLLSEVEQICDQVCVVSRGRQMYQGPLSGLTTGAGLVRVGVQETEAAAEALRALGWTHRREGDVLVVEGVPAREVNRALGERGIFAHEIHEEGRKLEDVFLELTEGLGDA